MTKSSGRTIAIGDIHGCDVALEGILRLIEPRTDDVIVVLGDVIDRGPDSKRCIELLLDLKPRCRFVHLMGNHEEMMLDALYGGPWSASWPAYGGEEMLKSYGGGFDRIPREHLDFIRSGKDYYQTDKEIFVHALLRPQIPPEQEQVSWLRWARFQEGLQGHISGKRVICGHTAQSGGHPAGSDHYLCIDTCAYCPKGALSALETGSDTLWQATQSGETRGPMNVWDAM